MDDSSDRKAAFTPADTQPAEVPRQGPLLGLDYGTRRIGVAICPPEQNFAAPLEIIQRTTVEQDAKRLEFLATDYRAVGLVVGLPVHMSGDEGGKAREARRFGGWASQITRLPVVYWAERYTSAAVRAQPTLLALLESRHRAALSISMYR